MKKLIKYIVGETTYTRNWFSVLKFKPNANGINTTIISTMNKQVNLLIFKKSTFVLNNGLLTNKTIYVNIVTSVIENTLMTMQLLFNELSDITYAFISWL